MYLCKYVAKDKFVVVSGAASHFSISGQVLSLSLLQITMHVPYAE
jgi:hypothetical protein